MMSFIKGFPLIIILILFITAFIMPLIKKTKIVKGVSLISMSLSMILALINLVFVINNGEYLYRIGHFNAPYGIEFRIGIIEAMMGLLFSFVALMIIWYSVYVIEKEIKESKVSLYYLLINILIGSLLGVVYSNDLFNCFVFIEVGTLASCGTIIVKDKKENIKATLKYLIMSCLGSGLVLMGIAYLYSMTGHLNINYIHKELIKTYLNYPNAVLIAIVLFIIGLGVKSAMFPLHNWLPDAHSSAPSSSSAILSSLVLKAFVLLMIKVLYRVFGIEILNHFSVLNIILILGSLGMIMGSIFAIFQKNIKRVIAYSTVAQMGYIFLGIGLGSDIGVSIAIFHIIGHALTKSALFLSVGAMIEQTGHKSLDHLKGIGKEMPFTLGLFSIGALSMIGIPILPGFISKWHLSLASISAGNTILIAVILISSLLNAVYYFPIVINGYFGEDNLKGKIYKSKSKPLKELMPVIFLVISMISVGLASSGIINLISLGFQ
ncbi:complex I subunit 5 family protein [Clostridium lacusfryxellense]|uniref:complex I subunit 5 family protein n=1 Tax=Clostridium lacusfryxellense TaxID=205328 RepID=UPI001C0E0F00|nr:proton-conducting transporter membrane subunit [Clostridium lacusfryxellense]MBU3113543.1 monovalent cation/H+ antiporter subunit D family protein [Clostridium lacusfryxellense]